MSRRITGAQKPFKMLVANLSGPTDPSKTPGQVISKNAKDNNLNLPVGEGSKIRSSYETQLFPEISGKGFQEQVRSHKTPGRSTRQGLMTYTVPNTAVAPTFSVEFSAAIAKPIQIGNTRIIIGDITVIPDMDFTVVAGDDVTTAANFGTYITTTFGWAHILAAGKCTVELPSGLDYNNILVTVTGPDSGFYTVTPVLGYPNSGEPFIGPATIG